MLLRVEMLLHSVLRRTATAQLFTYGVKNGAPDPSGYVAISRPP